MEPFKNRARASIPGELPCTSYSSNLWNVQLGKITFGLDQSKIVFKTTVFKGKRKANLLTTRLKIKDIL